MNRRVLLIILLLLPSLLWAGNVDVSRAKKVAIGFLSENGISCKAEDLAVVKTLVNQNQGETALYMFNIADKGYIVVLGSDCVRPVAAYSFERGLDPADIAPAFMYMMREKAHEACFAQDNKLEPSAEIAGLWSKLEAGGSPTKGPRKSASYLMHTTWHQGDPYNIYCPIIEGDRAIVGCVATALAQILRYWEHPTVGEGSSSYFCQDCRERLGANYGATTYDFPHMPLALYNTNSSTEKIATATLCYHAGVSVMMQYHEGSSGVSMSHVGSFVKTALTRYFKYDTIATELFRTQFADNDSMWMNFVRFDIQAQRPVFYCGYDNGSEGNDAGHAFVCDGFDETTNFFHFNWGWGGQADGWFDLYNSALDAGGYHFRWRQLGVFGIQPRREPIIPDEPEPVEGIDDIQVNMGNIYPNPSHNTITIPYQIEEQSLLDIYTISGQKVFSQKLTPGEDAITVDVRLFAPGVYVCKLNGTSKKFIVQ